jgi:hypothetical protein
MCIEPVVVVVVVISPPSIFTLGSLVHSLRSFSSFACFAGQVSRLRDLGFFVVCSLCIHSAVVGAFVEQYAVAGGRTPDIIIFK